MLMEVQQSLSWLALSGVFGEVVIIPAVAGQSLYQLPPNTLRCTQVIYDMRVLRYATEYALDQLAHLWSWEGGTGEPRYWTTDNQGPNLLKLVPAPLRSGSTVMDGDTLPMSYTLVGNILVFLCEDPVGRVTSDESVMPTLLDWDDLLVYKTAGALAMRETPQANYPVAEACQALVSLWTQLLGIRVE